MAETPMALFGTDEPQAEERVLTAGPLTAIFSAGALRSISLQGVEVIRGLYFLVRDRNWATAVPEIRDLTVDQGADGFSVRFEAHCRTPSDGQSLVWKGRISGSAAEGVSFEAEATPDEDLLTRRTGFIVLHPLERVVGAAATVEDVHGRRLETTFPDLVDPLQSFFNVAAMTLEPMPGIRATCRMEGGGWETEDHRNWLDASFKTYFRALALPHPYTVPAGQTVLQRITVTFEPSVAALPVRSAGGETLVTVGDRTGGTMPRIGLTQDPANLDAAIAAAEGVRAIGAHEIALRLRSDAADLPGLFRRFAQLADALGADPVLELALAARSDPPTELETAAIAATQAGLDPAAVFVTPEIDLGAYPPSYDRPPSAPLRPIFAATREAFPGAAIGGGSFNFFTELNRRPPPADLLDFVQYGTAANVHAADDRSVMETLEALPHQFRTLRALAPSVGYHVGPAHIAMAVNPYGAATTPNPDRRRMTMVSDDPRHKAQFGAAWAAGYLARAAIGGVDKVAMGAITGPFGLTHDDGTPTAMFHVLAGFAALAGTAVLQCASSDPRSVLAVAAEGPRGRTMWLANLTPGERTVRVAGLVVAGLATIRGGAAPEPQDTPADGLVSLAPYALARITW